MIEGLSELPKQPPFEKKLEELNGLIKQLEKGDLALEDAIQTFERGKKLHGELVEKLTEFERRIEVLTRGLDGQDRTERAPDLDPDGRHDANIPF
jgi:exodeoxyribonuclease VII small subunit